MNTLLQIGIAAAFYLAFLLWYGGRGKPMTKEEVQERISTLKKIIDQENAPDEGMIKSILELTVNDDGREFWMVNLMKYRDTDPHSEAMAAHKRYSKAIFPDLLRNGSFPMFASHVQGRFLFEGVEDQWDDVAIVRYRSRRNFLKFATAAAKKDLAKDKWLSLEKTHVFPVKSYLRLGTARIGVFLVLSILILLMNVF